MGVRESELDHGGGMRRLLLHGRRKKPGISTLQDKHAALMEARQSGLDDGGGMQLNGRVCQLNSRF